ncbi:hypothetical protein Afil01_22290 [Actinorhabdospora filicis]|uniref:Uncharacterized protein n=1 Tax=Actinorhabdospora filicis TaxID=1785913 RepID=A0A9W6W2V1_9ACTN|nr:hypothetical protein [Actinorhabdospora filicis]GLZ77422.1 hypothetical protein Afil01_22290 [Actinorhabdospora filicis]
MLRLPRLAAAVTSLAAATLLLSACSGLSDGEREEYTRLAARMGVPLDYIWVLDLRSLSHGKTGDPGVFGESSFEDHYSTPDGSPVRLTVDSTVMDDASCPGIPIAGVSSSVQCVAEDGGWLRTTGLSTEFAEERDGVLVRVTVDEANAAVAKDAVKSARPADADELEDMLAKYRTDDEK